jgi:Zn-dependent protease
MSRPEPAASLAGSFRLFQVAGIGVYLHWSWLLVAYFELQYRVNIFSSQVWNAAEYLTLFAIVLLHELGHALACRQVGGQANQIVLWPLGGIAYVNPPPRPGAVLWSIAAGPLVNVVLAPVTIGAYIVAGLPGVREMITPDMLLYLRGVSLMNLVLLIFNMLPIYPLDGGQIVQALLWFVIGRVKSLMVVSVIGMAAGGAALLWAATNRDVWFVVIAGFAAYRSWVGFQQARIMARILNAPRHEGAACPSCRTPPIRGEFWACETCRARFDTFAHRAVCPGCGNQFPLTVCPACGQGHPIAYWFVNAAELNNDQPA